LDDPSSTSATGRSALSSISLHRENACFVLTCHLFISGRAARVALIEDLVRCMRRQSGVWFTTCEEGPRWHDKQRA
jgi:hypothetical protein